MFKNLLNRKLSFLEENSMRRKKQFILLVTAGTLALLVCGVTLAITQPAKAQCGSQASSCKNCHEVQAKDPVNNDGTSWHQSHAFGDFCYICHGGNQQATDETTAHAGMVPPLSDVKASCQQCHPNDLDARAQIYASALGVEIGKATGSATVTSTPVPTEIPAATEAPAAAPQQASVAPDDSNLVNYVQRYNEDVLGRNSINWGNIVLLVMIGAMVLGGGGLVMHNEHLVNISFRETRPITEEYPTDVVDLLPEIARLKPNARKSLRRLLSKPEATAEVLTSIDKLTDLDSSKKKE